MLASTATIPYRLAKTEQGDHAQSSRGIRIAMKGAIPDDLAHPIVQVDAGREAKIDPHRPQFSGQQ